ncbi:MAG: hypothetical protein U0610_32500 [bacterium]
MPRLTWKEVAVPALFGAGLTLCDRMHWRHGALSYPRVGLLAGQPLWVPPLFALGAVVLVLTHRWVVGFRLGHAPRATVAAALAQTSVFVLAYACTAWFHRHPWSLAAALTASWIPVALSQRYRGFVAFALVAAVLGPLAECGVALAGGFHYTHPELGPVPIWLPPLYLWAAYCGAGLDRWLAALPER